MLCFITDYKVSQILCKEKPNLSFLQPHVKASLLLDSIAAALHLLNPKIKIWIPMALFISYRSSGEKLRKYQANSSCVIMFVILMTTLFYKAVMYKEKFDADHS